MVLPRASVLPTLAVVLGAALSFGAFFAAQSLEREHGRAVFERHAENGISIPYLQVGREQRCVPRKPGRTLSTRIGPWVGLLIAKSAR